MPFPPPLPSSALATDVTPQRTVHADDHNKIYALLAAMVPGAWQYVNPIGGAAPAFVSPWGNYSGGTAGWQPLRFRKEGDTCRLEGLVAGGTSGSTIFTLPLGFRPAQNRRFPVMGSTSAGSPTQAFGWFDVNASGVVYATMAGGGGSGNWTAVDLAGSWTIDPLQL